MESNKIIKINNMAEYDELLSLNANKLIVIDFYAVWCGPCKMIAPKVEAMAEKETNVIFAKIDVDDEDVTDIIAKNNITSMPTFLFFKNKELVGSVSGANEGRIRDMIDSCLN